MDSDIELTRALRRSIRDLLAEPDGDLEISSLLRAISDSPDLWDVAQQELAPRAGHLDLHIEGAGTDQHRTVAKSFGTFVSAMADAVKYTMREISNISRSPDELLIEPGPGSVRAVFIAPTRIHSGALEITETLDEVLPEEDSYSESLRRTAVVLANATTAGVDSAAVDGALAAIPAPARPELRRALSEVVAEGWALSGSFAQRGLPTMSLSVSPGSAKYLRDRLEETITQTESWECTGVLDGHTWSSNTMRFIPADRSGPITASFDSARVQSKVARLDAEPGKRVQARFRVLITKSQARPSGRRSYALIDIEELAADSVLLELDGT